MAECLHHLPKHPERWLPMFNHDEGIPDEENLYNYMLAINLNGVEEEYFVCRPFPYTFVGSVGSVGSREISNKVW